jgi:hypothetical protein
MMHRPRIYQGGMRSSFIEAIERGNPIQFENGFAGVGNRHDKATLAKRMRELDKPQHVDPTIAAFHHGIGVMQMAV